MYIHLIFLFSLCSKVCSASVNITSIKVLRDPDEITSNGNHFKLGFFRPPKSTNRYVGIWYNTNSDALEVVWVANKENPLKGSSGVFRLSEDGNLQVLDGQNKVFWSSNLSHDNASNSSVAYLQDTGNLVLYSNERGGIIWQSFQHPTDTLLPKMRNGVYQDTNKRHEVVRSWKSPSDPSSGRFTIGMTPRRPAEGFVWDNGRPYWRTGPWNGNFFIGLPRMYYWVLIHGFTLQNDHKGLPTLMFSSEDPAVMDHYVLTHDGVVLHKEWNEANRNWDILWKSIDSDCDVYGKCGPFGICNPREPRMCRCLEGFKPTNYEEWNKGNWTSGCSRRTPLQCGMDGFSRLKNVKVPDLAEWLDTNNEVDCSRKCQGQCSCLAYAYYLGIGCMVWNRTLIDIQEFNVTSVDLFIRLAHSELTAKNGEQDAIVAAIIITATIILAVLAFFFWRCSTRRRAGRSVSSLDKLLYTKMLELHGNNREFNDLLLFKFEKLAVATNNFHESNKLGRGGFGPVFKGKLEDGQEIAVKRLSSSSGQDLREFMNEVSLISKLQHRNLVRLLGCCVEEEEKMLVYEYMPNKSLDALLFDPSLRLYLDWKMRVNIIQGICRGLLYLHRDSRLRIIHRDLKASNVLLDEDLNPKISDFGMARIFGGKEDQVNTTRVAGTYGYMSPEYAMAGRFSEKSDVYSFGVLLLEIVSGRKNNCFTEEDQFTSLLGYAWKLWNEDDIHQLIDPTICSPSSTEKVIKCIHIGLLCVQEFPEDRPTISRVVSMLDSEISDLPRPRQPGFIERRTRILDKITSKGESGCSENYASITIVSGR